MNNLNAQIMKLNKGSASVELAVITPFVFVVCVVAVQVFSAIFSATENVEFASFATKERLKNWQNENSFNGILRPCIEKLEPNFEEFSGFESTIGLGKWSVIINSPQTLYITNENICSNN